MKSIYFILTRSSTNLHLSPDYDLWFWARRPLPAWDRNRTHIKAVGIVKVLVKAQRQQTAINKKYTVNRRAEKVEKVIKEAEVTM